jgi:hypothetical protein
MFVINKIYSAIFSPVRRLQCNKNNRTIKTSCYSSSSLNCSIDQSDLILNNQIIIKVSLILMGGAKVLHSFCFFRISAYKLCLKSVPIVYGKVLLRLK